MSLPQMPQPPLAQPPLAQPQMPQPPLAQPPLAFKPGDVVKVKILNVAYCLWIVLCLETGVVFALEKFGQTDAQGTSPVLAGDTVKILLPVNPPTREEAKTYWSSSGYAINNFGVDPRLYIGDEVTIKVLENTGKNTIFMVISMTVTTPDGPGVIPCDFKAYACQSPSMQCVVDTPTLVTIDGVIYIRVILRGQGTTVDYPGGIAIAGGGFVDGKNTIAETHNKEAEEEGANPKDKIEVKTFALPPDTDPKNDPRYCVFDTESGKSFGMPRERLDSIQVRYFGNLLNFPVMYKATDCKEVAAGFWMSVEKFLALSEDRAVSEHVAWPFHMKIVSLAIDTLEKNGC